jgi:hypothetical protein
MKTATEIEAEVHKILEEGQYYQKMVNGHKTDRRKMKEVFPCAGESHSALCAYELVDSATREIAMVVSDGYYFDYKYAEHAKLFLSRLRKAINLEVKITVIFTTEIQEDSELIISLRHLQQEGRNVILKKFNEEKKYREEFTEAIKTGGYLVVDWTGYKYEIPKAKAFCSWVCFRGEKNILTLKSTFEKLLADSKEIDWKIRLLNFEVK